jgi:hypothetical protein
MPDQAPDRLQRLLEDGAAAAARRAVDENGEISQDELDRLARLARLIEIRSTVAPRDPPRVWPIAAIALGTVIVVTILLFARIGETEIELDVVATEVSFSLPSQQVLLENVALVSLGASGLSGVELPEPLAETVPAEVLRESIRLASVRNESGAGTITIGSLIPAGGTAVWLGEGDVPPQYRLSLRNPQTFIQVDVVGPIQIAIPGMEPRVQHFASPRAIRLEPSEGITDVVMEFLDAARPGLTPQVPIQGLSFSRINEFADRGISIVRRLSTIRSGTLYWESLTGQQRQLRAGEALRFEEVAGEMRSAAVEDGHLALSFHGRVRGMQTGSEDSPRTLMPTWLEWLRAQHGLELFWGTTGYLFGVALAVVRWFKGTS